MSSFLRRLTSRRLASRRLLPPPATKSFSTATTTHRGSLPLATKSFSTATTTHRGSLLRRPSSPWLMLPPSLVMDGMRGDMVYNFYSPITGKVESFNNRGGKEETEPMMDGKTDVVGSSHGWLALFNRCSQRMFLSNPISGRRIELPPITRLSEKDSLKDDLFPHKVITSSSPEEKDCVAVAILTLEHRAAFCRPGDAEWAPLGPWLSELHDSPVGPYAFHSDFVHSAARKTLFGLSVSGCCGQEELEGWDMTTDPAGPITVRVGQLGQLGRAEQEIQIYRYLVCGSDDQLFVVRAACVEVENDIPDRHKSFKDFYDGYKEFSVYRIREAKYFGLLELEECSSLDDTAMFVGMNHSFAVKASEYPGLKGNCIYYSDPRLICPYGQFFGMFDIKTKTCTPLYFDSSIDWGSLNLFDFKYFPWFTPSPSLD